MPLEWEAAVTIAQAQIRITYKARGPAREAWPVERYRSYLRYDRIGYLSAGRLLELQRELETKGEPANAQQHDELVLYATALLRERMPMPPWLADYSADVIEGRRRRPRQHGPPPNSHRRRNAALHLAMMRLVYDHGMPAYTNNDASLGAYFTAAQAVAEAAMRAGIRVGASTVAREWARWEDVTPAGLNGVLTMFRDKNYRR